jgi:hypothetical protein
MKTTIDLPEDILLRAKIAAARQHSTLKELVIEGLEHVLGTTGLDHSHEAPLARLREGLRLGSQPLTRDEIHARR